MVVLVLFPSVVIHASDISAAIYQATIRVTNNSTAATVVSVPVDGANTSVLITDGYLNADADNCTVTSAAGADIRFMPGYNTGSWFLFTDSIAANTIMDCSWYNNSTGGEIRVFGSIGVTDDASMEISDNGTVGIEGVYLGISDNISYKPYALKTTYDASTDNVTFHILEADDSTTWQTPDSASGWTDSSSAVDDDTGTKAQTTCGANAWSAYITMPYASGVYTDRVRIRWEDVSGQTDDCELAVYYGGAWHTLTDPGESPAAWETETIGSFQFVTSARFRVHGDPIGDTVYCYEFDFNLADEDTTTTATVTNMTEGEYDVECGISPPFIGIAIDDTFTLPLVDNLVYNLPFTQDEFNTTGDNFTSIDDFQHECDPVNAVWSSSSGYTFDGAGDYIGLPSTTINSTEGTFCFWVWFDRMDTAEFLFESGNNELSIYHNGSKELRFYLDGGSEVNTNIGTAYKTDYTGEWVHIGMTYKASGHGYLYLNGTQLTHDTNIGAMAGFAPGMTKIGSSYTGANAFDGRIGYFIYYDSQDDYEDVIQDHYEATYGTFASGGMYTLSRADLIDIDDTPYDWTFGSSTITPYFESANITVDGVLTGNWEWEYAATFTDLSGNGNTATPSFRGSSSDPDVSAEFIDFQAVSTARAPAYSVTGAEDFITANITATSNFTTGAVTIGGVPGTAVVEAAASAASVPNIWLWGIIGISTIAIIGIGISAMERKYGGGGGTIFIRLGVACTVMGIMTAFDIYDFWMMVIYLFVALAPVLASRHYDWGASLNQLNLIGFLSTCWIALTTINRIQEGQLLTSADTAHLNTMMFTQEFTLLNVFHLPIINFDFFSEGIPSLLKWDYSFFGGNAQIIQYLLYSITSIMSFIVLMVIIGVVSSYFTRRM